MFISHKFKMLLLLYSRTFIFYIIPFFPCYFMCFKMLSNVHSIALCNEWTYCKCSKWHHVYCTYKHTHCSENPICILKKGIAPPQSQFPHSWVCERESIHIFSCSRIGRPRSTILGIYKLLTDTWIGKLGLRLAIPFRCLCSVGTAQRMQTLP